MEDLEFNLTCGNCGTTVVELVLWAAEISSPRLLQRKIALRCLACNTIMTEATDDGTDIDWDELR